MNVFDLLMGLLQTLSVLFAAVAILFAARQVKLLRKTHKDNHEWNRRCEAQKAIVNFRHLQPIHMKLQEMFNISDIKDPISLDLIQEKINTHNGLEIEIRDMLNAFEGLARGIHQGIYDEIVVKKARRGIMIRLFNAFSIYIRHVRNINPKAYCEWESIVDEWKREQTKIDKRDKTG